MRQDLLHAMQWNGFHANKIDYTQEVTLGIYRLEVEE
jgi:hypothetical protein